VNMNILFDYTVDATGEAPPVPTILCKEALDRIRPGEVLKLTASYEGTVKNIRMLVSACNHELVAEGKTDEGYVFFIRKGDQA
jgi:TusA-related sulfurtransferase